MDAETQALEASVLPKAYDKIQPGQTVSYEEYIEILSGFYDRYGDSNEWTLEQAAQVSQFRQGYPFDRDLAVSILPGEDDMPEKEAFANYCHMIIQIYKTRILMIDRMDRDQGPGEFFLQFIV